MVEARSNAFLVVYATSGPNATLIAAAKAAHRLRVPWVADLRDLWTVDSLKTYPSSLHYPLDGEIGTKDIAPRSSRNREPHRWQAKIERGVGGRSCRSRHVIRTALIQRVQRSSLLVQGKQDRIELVHAGNLIRSLDTDEPNWTIPPYDLDNSARSVKPIVDGLRTLRGRSPGIADRFRVRLLGYVPDQSEAYIADAGMAHQVVCEGVRPRDEAIAAIRDASALLIVQVAFADPDKPGALRPRQGV